MSAGPCHRSILLILISIQTKIEANKHEKKGSVLNSVSLIITLKYENTSSPIDRSYIYFAVKAKIWATTETIKPTIIEVDSKVKFSTNDFILFFNLILFAY